MKLICSKKIQMLNIALVLITLLANILANRNFKTKIAKQPGSRSVQDTTSVYTAEDAVGLLVNISKAICVKGADAKTYDDIITDCLNNILNQQDEYGDILKSFWNTCGDFMKNKSAESKKKINEDLIKGLISITNNMRVKISKYQNSSCGNMVVIGKFEQDKVITQIQSAFSKFNLENKPEGLYITSMASVHRNLADPKMFEQLNGGNRSVSPPLNKDSSKAGTSADKKNK